MNAKDTFMKISWSTNQKYLVYDREGSVSEKFLNLPTDYVALKKQGM